MISRKKSYISGFKKNIFSLTSKEEIFITLYTTLNMGTYI